MALPLASVSDWHFWLPDQDRVYGIHLVAAPGVGKSRLLGRYLAFSYFLRGVPTIVIDNGYTIDNFLHKVSLLPPSMRRQAWERIRYVDLAGGEYVVPFPLYYRLGNQQRETNRVIAERFVKVIAMLDPALRTASIQGFNAIKLAALEAGVDLVKRGWQITE